MSLVETEETRKGVCKDIANSRKKLISQESNENAVKEYLISSIQISCVISIISKLPYEVALPTIKLLESLPQLEDYLISERDEE